MEVRVDERFLEDLKKYRQDKELLIKIDSTIENVEEAKTLLQVAQMKKIKGSKNYYRIRIGCQV